MKNYNLSALLIAIFALASVNMLQAQYDDLYYDPDTDASYSSYDTYSSNDYQEETSAYDDYDEYDDNYYDYYYTSRIRRFHRPYYGFNYFDPVYVDMAYYDPFFRPNGVTVLIYDDFYGRNSWNSFRRFNRWNSWNRYSAWNSWGNPYSSFNRWNSWNSWDRWGSPYGFGGWNNAGWNSWNSPYGFGGGFNSFSNYYCPPSWGAGNAYNTVSSNNPQGTYSGPRRSGTIVTPNSNPRTTNNGLSQSSPRNTTSRNTDLDVRPNGSPRATTLERHTIRSGRSVDETNSRTRTSTASPDRSIDRGSFNNSRTRPSINDRSRSASPSYNRSTTPSRSYNTSPSRTYDRSNASPSRSYSPSPSRSTPSYSPSRSSSGSSINRSSSGSSSPARSSSGSSGGRTRSGGGE